MCKERYRPPEMLRYSSYDRDSALRLAAQERFDMMMNGARKNKHERRSSK